MWRLYAKARGPVLHGRDRNHPQPVIAHEELRNVPAKQNLGQGGLDWELPCPAVHDPSYWENREQRPTRVSTGSRPAECHPQAP